MQYKKRAAMAELRLARDVAHRTDLQRILLDILDDFQAQKAAVIETTEPSPQHTNADSEVRPECISGLLVGM